jgi:hypothetical protein
LAEEAVTKPDADGSKAVAATKPSETPRTQASDIWVVAGSDEIVALLTNAARDVGVTIKTLETAGHVGRGALLIVELPDQTRASALEAASKAGAFCVAILDEPTIGTFTTAVHGGARDVLAGKPTPQILAARADRWKSRGKAKKT